MYSLLRINGGFTWRERVIDGVVSGCFYVPFSELDNFTSYLTLKLQELIIEVQQPSCSLSTDIGLWGFSTVVARKS